MDQDRPLPRGSLNREDYRPTQIHMTGDPKREEIVLEDEPLEESALRNRLIMIEGTKYPNTDAIPTQPLRCLRDRAR